METYLSTAGHNKVHATYYISRLDPSTGNKSILLVSQEDLKGEPKTSTWDLLKKDATKKSHKKRLFFHIYFISVNSGHKGCSRCQPPYLQSGAVASEGPIGLVRRQRRSQPDAKGQGHQSLQDRPEQGRHHLKIRQSWCYFYPSRSKDQ